MGVSCHIFINKPNNVEHKAGSTVRGIVKYFIDEPTQYRDVTLSFLGRGECKWTECTGKSSVTYKGTEDYISQHVNIINKKAGKAITLQSGAYEYPFEFYLPEDIPTSYLDDNGWIAYALKLKFARTSFFSFNREFRTVIAVCGFVDLKTTNGTTISDRPVSFGLEKTLFAPFAENTPVVILKAEIEKTILTAGANVHLSYTVSNHTDVAVTAVKTELYYYTTYTPDCGPTKSLNGKVKGCEVETAGVPCRQVATFRCILPTIPRLRSVQRCRVISKCYVVRVTVRLPVPHLNAAVDVPVLFGEQRPADACLEATEHAPAQLPSYWEAMWDK